jgi:putative ABC transport system permease protein
MLRNYLVIALRNLRKRPGYSFINIGGLALGLACTFLITLYVRQELSFDRFHRNGDRTYRLLVENRGDRGTTRQAVSASGFAPDLLERYPEVEEAVRIDYRDGQIRIDDRRVAAGDFMVADAEFFEVFSFPLVQGDPATVLDSPDALVVTESTARALFGDADPIGRMVNLSDRVDLRVTGVAEDPPLHTHLPFHYVASFGIMTTLMGPDALHEFSNYNYFTYLLLRPGSDPRALEAKLPGYLAATFDPETARTQGLVLQPMAEIHFTTDVAWDVPTNTDVRYVAIFSAIALLVLVIACVNFMNLATARAAQRAREIGVRKAVGAHRGQLVAQFLGESVMLASAAVVLALALAAVAHPMLNELVGGLGRLSDVGPGVVLLLVGIGLVAGLAAGSYPAFYLSAFRPAAVLKGDEVTGRRAARLRKTLIVAQFAISVFLAIGTLTIRSQLGFMRTQDLGFRGEQVVTLPLVDPVRTGFDSFRQALLSEAHVLQVSRAGNFPGRVNTHRGYNWPGDANEESGRGFHTMLADFDYLETLGLELVSGRDFSRDLATDAEDAYILNEAAVRELGFGEPVGHPFRAWDREMGRVIGVVKDFHFKSLQQQIEPLVINIKPGWTGNVAIRIAPADVPAALATIERQWRTFAPGFPFDYRFLDQDFDRHYRTEDRLATLFTIFALVAVFVACLGLFGLAAYSAARRTKEIGIRKVMGASEAGIALLLTREFIVLVGIGFVVAAVPAYVVMRSWLARFAYRIDVPWTVFVAAGLLSLLVAWLTVLYQATRAAQTDPVRALRYE